MVQHQKVYRVTWTIDIEASSPEVAALEAREIQLRPDSIATIFECSSEGATTTVDAAELEG